MRHFLTILLLLLTGTVNAGGFKDRFIDPEDGWFILHWDTHSFSTANRSEISHEGKPECPTNTDNTVYQIADVRADIIAT